MQVSPVFPVSPSGGCAGTNESTLIISAISTDKVIQMDRIVTRNPALVRSSCSSFTSELVKVDLQTVHSFAASIDVNEIHAFCDSVDGLSTNRFDADVSFASKWEEAGFILFAHGLDFGSGFRNVLHHARQGQGAWLTIRAGLVKMGKVNPALSASWLAGLSTSELMEYFDLGGNVDELTPLATQLTVSVNEIGASILSRGFTSPGHYLENVVGCDATGGSVARTRASALVAELVATFPLTFMDEYTVNDQIVCFYKKAQLVVSELFMRFHEDFSAAFNFADVDSLTAFVDNVVVAMMRKFRTIVCQEYIDIQIASGKYIMKGSEEEVALRAAALTAMELITLKCNELNTSGRPLNAQRVCNWVWGCLGKKPENRSFPRHLAPSTSFY
jgi:hypothetical protein